MKLAIIMQYAISGIAAMLLIACDALAGAPMARPEPSASPASPLAALPAPTSAAASTVFPITITPRPDQDGIPDRIPTTPFPTSALPAQPAANFAFSFGYGACQITRVFNSFDNTLTQHSIGASPITTTLVLTANERSAIYQRMRAINLFAYPARYSIPVPDTMIRISHAPYSSYEFTLRNDTLLKTITWEDEISKPTSDEADQLRDLIAFLVSTINGHPELQRIPPLVEACA
jgi:hypothetical protein